jgi:hypothetical protein
MSLYALIRVVQEFFGGITALLCDTPHCSYAILDCIGNRASCAGRPLR